ncbi:MAG: cellulose binding domain-containing protein [Firmicutes bacterium]|nr:cellulose binding domain-containing protein [Bacillota bacterium]
MNYGVKKLRVLSAIILGVALILTLCLVNLYAAPVTVGNFVVDYVISSDWGTGATINVTLKNNGPAVNGWTVGWTFPGNQTITNMWNATYTQSGASVSAKDAGYNASLPTGGSTSFGFNVNYSGTNAAPTSFTVNSSSTSTPTPTQRGVTATPTRRVTPTPTPRGVTPTPTPRANTPTPTQGQTTGGPVGWAAVNYLGQNGTTGGAGGPTIHVYSKAELEAAAYKDDNPAIIVVHGTLTGGPAMNTNVRSNKTIIGDGAGAYLNFGLYLRGNNIIIKNLDIMNGGYNPGDSEGLDSISFAQDLHHIWVDHCTMHETMDGTVDPTRNCRFVTISYCKFHTQNTTVLIGGSDSDDAAKSAQSSSDKRNWHYTVTVHHNYWTGVNSRCPRVRFGPVHVFNNYYENLGDYAIGRGDRANIYSENNYFYNAGDAFAAYDDSSNPGYVNDVGSLFEGDNGNTTDNPPSGTYAWTPGQYYSYTAHSAAWVKANLKNYCGIGKGNP